MQVGNVTNNTQQEMQSVDEVVVFYAVLNRYLDLRDEEGHYLPEYYHLLAIRLAFVIVFEVRVLSFVLESSCRNES